MKLVFKQLTVLLLIAASLVANQSCKSGKIACPTYADSTPKKKGKAGSGGTDAPPMPKAKKAKSGVLPKGYGKK